MAFETDMSRKMRFLALIVIIVSCFVIVEGQNLSDIATPLTQKEKLEIFGSDALEKAPTYDIVDIDTNVHNSRGVGNRTDDTSIQVQLKAFGQKVVLDLKPNTRFMSRGCLVHHFKENATQMYPCSTDLLNCFYTGRAENHSSSAAANICDGLHGIVTLEYGTLIIKPLTVDNTSTGHVSSHAKRHVIYRYDVESKGCSTSDAGHGVFLAQPYHHQASNSTTNKANITEPLNNHQPRITALERHIEVAIVVDPSIVKFHGNGTQRYVQSIMNVAAERFQDKTLGHKIGITITNIVILEISKADLTVVPDSRTTLNSFCSFQMNLDLNRPDVAILLTKENLQDENGNPSIVGLANTNGICKFDSKCLIVEDWGLGTGFTIAHEMGHLMGMKHDGETINGKVCPQGQNIMSPSGASGPSAYQWSTCSREQLEIFFSNGDGECLTNIPSEPPLLGDKPLLGTLYTHDQQCKLLLGKKAVGCEDTTDPNMCKTLYCRKDTYSPCFGYPSARIDGTDCNNTRTWCIGSECVAMGNVSVPRVDGRWTGWEEYSPCSRTCGGGVKNRRRYCENPKPQYGGQVCSGPETDAKLCNVQSCHSDYKSEQCATKYGPSWKYLPLFVGQDVRCSLICSDDINDPKMIGSLLDGTKCSSELTGLSRCLWGECEDFGCDGTMNSGIQYDECRVCKGNGSRCTTVIGSFSQSLTVRNTFETIHLIPKGSTTVVVRQTGRLCAINLQVNGTPLLGTDPTNLPTGMYTTNDVTVSYRRYPQTIIIIGPLPIDVNLQVSETYFSSDDTSVYRPNVTYKYYVPVPVPLPTLYVWAVRGYGICSRSCGIGESLPDVSCVDSQLNEVADWLCRLEDKPRELIVPCNLQPCPPRWHVTHWNECPVTCGGGTKRRGVECIQGMSRNSSQVLTDDMCDRLSRPIDSITCAPRACPDGVWRIGVWSQCSTTCCKGVKHRNVSCYDDSYFTTIAPEYQCAGTPKPKELLICIDRLCDPVKCGSDCRDVRGNCHLYGDLVCSEHAVWSATNCAKFCKYCEANTTDLVPDQCADLPANTCTDYSDYMMQFCRGTCAVCACRDTIANCDRYDKKYCTDAEYVGYMQTKCRSYCGLCPV